MDIIEANVLLTLNRETFVNQRVLAEQTGYSVGAVNRSIRNLTDAGLFSPEGRITAAGRRLLAESSPKRAIILAAGFGMRMVPINLETPKPLLEVNGEPLIERVIRQLNAVGIQMITVVVGFMKEQFEYLIDDFGVELVVNEAYASKNNLHSLSLVADRLSNCYIIPGDLWCAENPFNQHELYSWYMVGDELDEDSTVRVNRKEELVKAQGGNAMYGIAYLREQKGSVIAEKLTRMDAMSTHDNSFWEETLYEGDRMIVDARVVNPGQVYEINTYEQLRELDENSNQLKSEAIETICRALEVSASEVQDITILKKGMTNRSFLFSCKNKRYICRIPGQGTDKLINRRQEAEVYTVISPQGVCDNIAYINPENGFKITEYIEGARVCNPEDWEDVEQCMKKLHDFHDLNLKVNHTFDIFGQIEFYESLWNGEPSAYRDYEKTKKKVFDLKIFIDALPKRFCLTHIDAVPDNFLFEKTEGAHSAEEGHTTDRKLPEKIHLIDWEYAGMQDPHVDLAMFAIYAYYDKDRTDRLIDFYFASEGGCPKETRIKIYAYMAACGLLWSNWCDYKRTLGVEFGEYSLRQYRYAKEFYRIVQEELGNV